jgi:segregation and condensation protein A
MNRLLGTDAKLEPANLELATLETVMLEAVTAPFTARFAGFSGSLLELAAALRSDAITPAQVPLLQLTREVLERFKAIRAQLPPEAALDLASEALPQLSSVIELKARLLLPRPIKPNLEDGEDAVDAALEDVLSGVEALAKLEGAIQFLKERRLEHAGIIAPQPFPVSLQRRARPLGKGLGALVAAAKSKVREVNLFDLALDRLTLPQALERMREFSKKLRRFFFRDVPQRGWGEQTVLFSALLEGVREGTFEAAQETPYGDIEIKRSA